MKRILTFALFVCLSLAMAACGGGNDSPPAPPANPDTASAGAPHQEEQESEYEMTRDVTEFGLTVNGTDYPVPMALKEFLDDGWSVSDQTPYFLSPMAGEDYYETRVNLSLSDDGKGVRAGGSIIRLLEKDGVLLEVTIANQTDPQTDGEFQRIEDGVVDSITVFYDEAHTSIQLKGMELNGITPEQLLASYPGSDGWTHSPTNYSDYPEFGIATEYWMIQYLDNSSRSIFVYFNLENVPFKVTVSSKIPLKAI